MLILLPPSEGKTAPVHGDPVDLSSLVYAPELTGARLEVLDQLQQVAALSDPAAALGLPAGLNDELRAMTQILMMPAAPALEVYTGVLYGALGCQDWGPQAWERAASHVQIASALWAMVGAADQIPAYRLPPAAKLPGGKKPISILRPHAQSAMEARGASLVIDCRSSTYTPLWRPRNAQWYTVKIATLRDGKKVSVSHQAKFTRGQFVNFLMQRPGALPTELAELGHVVHEFEDFMGQEQIVTVDVQPQLKATTPGVIELVVPPVGG